MDEQELRDELERIKAHIDNQYRMIEEAIRDVEDGETGVPVEGNLQDIADEAERAMNIANETREAFYHVA